MFLAGWKKLVLCFSVISQEGTSSLHEGHSLVTLAKVNVQKAWLKLLAPSRSRPGAFRVAQQGMGSSNWPQAHTGCFAHGALLSVATKASRDSGAGGGCFPTGTFPPQCSEFWLDSMGEGHRAGGGGDPSGRNGCDLHLWVPQGSFQWKASRSRVAMVFSSLFLGQFYGHS